jgi:triosephosphate isomerase (TIM)
MILLNFKNYKETFGKKSLELAKLCADLSQKKQIEIIPIVCALDVYKIKKEIGISPYIQSVDGLEIGAKTGYINALKALESGARGSLINHSEKRIKPGTIKKMLKVWPKELESVLCLQSLGQTTSWAKNLKPTMIAYEPSYLIGSKDKSVATEKPKVIKQIVNCYEDIPVLAGAGIKNKEDVEVTLKMGGKGILLASGVIKSQDPREQLLKLISGFSDIID